MLTTIMTMPTMTKTKMMMTTMMVMTTTSTTMKTTTTATKTTLNILLKHQPVPIQHIVAIQNQALTTKVYTQIITSSRKQNSCANYGGKHYILDLFSFTFCMYFTNMFNFIIVCQC